MKSISKVTMAFAAVVELALVLMNSGPAKAGTDEPAKVRVAFWGLVHDHGLWVLPQVIENPEAQLVGVGAERNDLFDRVKQIPADVPRFTNLVAMLDATHPDALVTLAPNNQHLSILRECAKRHIHMYTHKPMATTGKDARAMAKLAKEARITFMINTHPLFEPPHTAVFAKWRSGELGPIQKLLVVNGHQGPEGINALTEDYKNWLYDPVQHGGGALLDQAMYGLYYATIVLGKPQAITATIAHRSPKLNRGVDDDSWVLLEYPTATAVVQGSWALPFSGGETLLVGIDGAVRTSDKGVLFRKRTPSIKAPGPQYGEPLVLPEALPERKNGVSYFIHSVRRGEPVEEIFRPEIHVLVNEMADAALLSAKTGRRISFR
jgi:predicted dehydrogenase